MEIERRALNIARKARELHNGVTDACLYDLALQVAVLRTECVEMVCKCGYRTGYYKKLGKIKLICCKCGEVVEL